MSLLLNTSCQTVSVGHARVYYRYPDVVYEYLNETTQMVTQIELENICSFNFVVYSPIYASYLEQYI